MTENALKAIIAFFIILGIPRKPFLNAVKPFIKLAGIPFMEVTVQSLRATVDLEILLGSSLKLLAIPSFKFLSILRISAIKPPLRLKADASPNLSPLCFIL